MKNKVRKNEKQLDRVTKDLMRDGGVEAKAGKTGSSPVEVTNRNGNWCPILERNSSTLSQAQPVRGGLRAARPRTSLKVVADTGKWKVIVNSEHPFYDKIYRGNNNAIPVPWIP